MVLTHTTEARYFMLRAKGAPHASALLFLAAEGGPNQILAAEGGPKQKKTHFLVTFGVTLGRFRPIGSILAVSSFFTTIQKVKV